MGDQNQNPEFPQPQNPAPPVTTPASATPPSQGSQKVIQPSEEMIKEAASNPTSYYSKSPTPNMAATQNPQAPAPAPNPDQPQTTIKPPNPSSIYPEANDNPQQLSSTPTDDKTDKPAPPKFGDGYSTGGSIFLFQLLAGIVLGLVLLVIDYSVLRTANISVIAVVSLLYFLAEFIVVAYIPYSTLKSDNVEEPFWLTLFGVAIQSVIGVILIEAVYIVIRSVVNHGVSSSLTHTLTDIGGSGLKVIGIVVYIGLLVAGYFLTKLSWGIAFALFGKISNKLIVKAIGIGVIAIIVGGITYHFLTLHSSNSSQPKIKISHQKLSSTVYTDYNSGYQITPPDGWTLANPPANTAGGQTSSLTWWYYQNDMIDNLLVSTTSPSSGSLQSNVQNWSSTKQNSNLDYKLISSTPMTVNGVPAYYIVDSWNTNTIKPQATTDQVLIEVYNGTEYTVDGSSYAQYSSSFSNVLKQSLLSFKP